MQEELIKDVVAHHLNSASLTIEQILRRAAFLRKAFTIDELMRRTSPESVRKKNNCSARMTRATPKIGLWLFTVKCRERTSKGPYDVRFKITKAQRLKDMPKRDIKTSCNCNAWKYNGSDYNSLHNDYNERQFSDNSAPNVRDPHRRNLICKHVAACIPIFARFVVPEEYKGFERRTPGAPPGAAPAPGTPRTPTPRGPVRTPTGPAKPTLRTPRTPRAPTTRPTRALR
jgi:hypothetical protein